jgi:hypothetical protein
MSIRPLLSTSSVFGSFVTHLSSGGPGYRDRQCPARIMVPVPRFVPIRTTPGLFRASAVPRTKAITVRYVTPPNRCD